MANKRVRHVARVILLDQAQNVLLVSYEDSKPMDPSCDGPIKYWVPPGGALIQDEDHRTAAIRELREETGLSIEPGPWLWFRKHNLRLMGQIVPQWERFYLAKVDMETPPVSNQSPEAIKEHRWWSFSELQLSSETFFPDGFVTLLAPVIEGRLPETPLLI